MKKFSSILASFLLLVLFFSGCKNFLNGGSFLEELDQSIVDAAAPAVDIYIEADANSGTASPSGKVSFKMGRTFSVIFTESKEYQFLGWEVIDRTTKESIENAIEILDTKDNETKFKILANRSNIQLHPICAERLTVTFSPNNSDNGAPRDSSINLTFNKNVSSENDFSKIQITCDGNDITQYYKEPVLNESILTFAADLENLIPVSGMKTVKVTVPQDLYYLQNEQKVTLGSDKSYSFKINNSTDNKAEITFNVASNSGSITPSGTNKYNIGDEVKIKFEPKTGISFKGWSILDGDGNVIKEDIIKVQDINAVETTLTIMKDVKGISITPKNVLIPTYITLLPVDSSTGNVSSQDTDIVIKFNTPIELSDFYDKSNDTFVNIVISSNNTNLISGSTATDRFKYYERPKISADKKTLTIATNKNNLQMPRAEKGQPATMKKDVTVTLKTTNVYAKEVKMNFTSDISWTYTIDNTVDSLDPQIESIKVYKDPQLKQELSSSEFTDEWSIDDIKRNYVSKIYVKIKGYDKDSGVKSLRVVERLWRDTNAIDKTATSEDSKPSYFTTDINNEAITNLGDGFYEAIIPVTFSNTPDGIVQIRFALSDYADNASKEVTYYVLKDTTLDPYDICPKEESHEIIRYINSSFKDSTAGTYEDKIIKKYAEINNDFIRIPNGDSDTVILDLNNLYEKTMPYVGLSSKLVITKVCWSYSPDESSYTEIKLNSENNKYLFTRNKTLNTYIKIFAEDSAGNQKSIVRVIPLTPAILDATAPNNDVTEGTSKEAVISIIKAQDESKINLPYKKAGYYTLYKYESDFITDNKFKIANNTLNTSNSERRLMSRIRGYSDTTTPVGFAFNPSNIDKTVANKNINDNIATADNYKDFRPEGNYYVYLLPYVEFDERTYFGALSNPIVLTVKYDETKKFNVCSKTTQTGEILPSDLPENFVVNKTKGPAGSGIYNISIQMPDNFVKNPNLTYFYRVRQYNDNENATKFYFTSETFDVDTLADNKYYVAIGVKNDTGKELYSPSVVIDDMEDNVPPKLTNESSIRVLNNYLYMQYKTQSAGNCYNPYDSSGLLINDGKTTIEYCLKKYEPSQESFISYSVKELENDHKLTSQYNPTIDFGKVVFPYSDYVEPGLYTMCFIMEDTLHNKGTFCFEVSTLENNENDNYSIAKKSNTALEFKMRINKNGRQYHFIDFLNDNNEWSYNYFDDNSGGNTTTSSKEYTLEQLGGGNNFVRVNANYVYNKHLHHFHTKYIVPNYYMNPENYPCKVKSFVKTDSGKSEIIVFSDVNSPTLARTVFSNINLNNISENDIDAETWSTYATEVSNSCKQDTGSFNYSVPVDSSEIPSGYWYTTLIHHANGDIIMTPPKQK